MNTKSTRYKNNDHYEGFLATHSKTFIAGAQWQKDQDGSHSCSSTLNTKLTALRELKLNELLSEATLEIMPVNSKLAISLGTTRSRIKELLKE